MQVDHPEDDTAHDTAPHLDYAVTGGVGAGIDPENNLYAGFAHAETLLLRFMDASHRWRENYSSAACRACNCSIFFSNCRTRALNSGNL